MKVFVSFSGHDGREVKDKIVSALRAELEHGDEVWESDMGCASEFSAECIDRLRESQVYICIISDGSLRESYLINELIEARRLSSEGKLNMMVYQITDAELPSQLVFQLNHISDANRLGRIRQDDSGIPMLVSKCRYLLTLRKNGTPEKPLDVIIPELNGTPFGSAGYFVHGSRDETLKMISDCLLRSNILFLSHINGFGRKSVLRKYAELHREDYDKIICINSFKGNLKEFFLYGLCITNLSDKAFENLSEEQVINRKCEMISRLGPRTLIVAPYLICDSSVEDYVYDALESVKCSIVFITPSVSKRICDRFNSIDVGRMGTEALDELFFHYYDSLAPGEMEDIKPALHSFYDYIGGHTQSVEITSNILSEEIDLYPEEIPAKLANWMKRGSDELSARITRLFSQLMDISSFSESERSILTVSSVLLQVPMSIKEYVALLRECDIYDADAVNRLNESGWLKMNKETRTVSIEPFIADTCLRSVKNDQDVIIELITYYFEKLYDHSLTASVAGLREVAKRLEYIFAALGMTEPQEMLRFFLSKCIYGGESTSSADYDEFREMVGSTRRRFRKEYGKKLDVDECLEQMTLLLKTVLYLNDVDSRSGMVGTMDMYNKLIFSSGGEIRSMIEALKGTEYYDLAAPLLDGINEFSFYKIIMGYVNVVNRAASLDRNDEEFYDIMYFLFILGYALTVVVLNMNMNTSHIMIEICRASDKLFKLAGFVLSSENASEIYLAYFRALVGMDILDEETQYAFEKWIKYQLDSVNEDKPDDMIACQNSEGAREYISAMIGKGRTDEAEKLYWKYLDPGKLPDFYAVNDNIVRAANDIAQEYIKKADIDTAKRFLKDALSGLDGRYLPEESESGMILDTLRRLYDLFENPEADSDFTDGGYQDYYSRYSTESKDRKKLARYMALSAKAMRYDFSSLSDGELKEKSDELRSRISGDNLTAVIPEAFALVSESGMRTLGYKHHQVQYMGAAAILDGGIAQILNGEGKTYTIILAAFVYYLLGKQVHICDSSAYLTRRNFEWMRETLELLGVKVGLLDKSYYSIPDSVDLTSCDVIYEDIIDAVFYRLKYDFDVFRPRFRYDVIISDEADLLMVEMGRENCVIRDTGVSDKKTDTIGDIFDFVCSMDYDRELYFTVNSNRGINLREEAYAAFEAFTGVSLLDPSPYGQWLNRMLRICITCMYIYKQGADYYISGGVPRYENLTTGEFSSFDDYWEYFLRRKHDLPVTKIPSAPQPEYGRMSFFEYIKYFDTICGATATAISMRKEFRELFGLGVTEIPPNVPVIREDNQPVVFITKQTKYEEILYLAGESAEHRQPVLIVTGSIKDSRYISRMLSDNGIDNVLLNAENSEQKTDLLTEAATLGRVTVTTSMANRGVDIVPGGDPRGMARADLLRNGVSPGVMNRIMFGKSRDPKSEKIRRSYRGLTAMYKEKTDGDRALIAELGGLRVIGTECFEDLRTEQQLRGRSGRQGFPGESFILYSLEDDFFVRNNMTNIKTVLTEKLHTDEDSVIESKMLNNSLNNARKKISLSRLISLRSSKYVLYYSETRKRLNAVLDDFISGRVTSLQYYREQFAERPDVIEIAVGKKPFPKAVPSAGGSKAPGELFWEYFFSQKESVGVTKRNAVDALMTVIEKLQAMQLSARSVPTFYGKSYREYLMQYYSKLDAEIYLMEKKGLDEKKKDAFLKKVNQQLCDVIIRETLMKDLDRLTEMRMMNQ